jgi:ligand-binding sensor domain-containing protein
MTNNGLLPPPDRGIVPSHLPQKEKNDPLAERSFIRTWAGEVQVHALAVDRDGQLWGAGAGGVVRWTITPTQISYRVWHIEHGLADGDVLCLCVTADNHIFVGHASGRVSEFNQRQWRIHETGEAFAVRALGLSPHGHVLACTDADLFDIHTGKAAFADTVPAPPLCVLAAFDRLWLGTENGLYERQADGWHWRDDVPLRGITAMYSNGSRFWLAGVDGALVGHPDTTWERLALKDTIYNITTMGQHVLAATGSGLWADAGAGFQRLSPKPKQPPQPVRAVVASGGAIIHTTGDNVQHIDTVRQTKPRLLLPERQFAPRDVRRVFRADNHNLIQTLDGTVWLDAGSGWKDVMEQSDMAVTAALLTASGWLVSLNARKGLARLVEGRLQSENTLAFVVDLIQFDNAIYAATVNGIFHSTDGIEWQGIAAIQHGSILGLVDLGGELVAITTQGIYAGTANMQRVSQESVRTYSAAANQLVYVTRDNTLHLLDTNLQDSVLHVGNIGYITCVAIVGKTLALGTPHGLKLLHSETLKPLTHIALPFTSAIMEMQTVGNVLWLLTAIGAVEVALVESN